MVGEEKLISNLQDDNILLESDTWQALETVKYFYGGFLKWVRSAKHWNLSYTNFGLLVEYCEQSGEVEKLWYYSGCVPELKKWAVCIYDYNNGPQLLANEEVTSWAN